MCENKVLRIFGCKKEEVIGKWRKFPAKELHNLYLLLDIRVTKSWRMKESHV
jgi:hypothetical protein